MIIPDFNFLSSTGNTVNSHVIEGNDVKLFDVDRFVS